jgi:hypothetical protein
LVKYILEHYPETDWEVLKTEGIDMDQDFVWFDDSLFGAEKRTLEAYHALDGYYRMDPKAL